MPNNETIVILISNILCICFRIIVYVCILENFKYICKYLFTPMKMRIKVRMQKSE
jgi:hypothetical protein